MAALGFDWRNFDAYLFDIDGTLLNSRDGVHYNSFHKALRDVYGCEGRIDGVPVHGNTDPGILRAALDNHGMGECDFEGRLATAIDVMCGDVEEHAELLNPELCPAINDLLAFLDLRDKLLGVVTGNLERIAWRKLQAAGLRRYFHFGSFSDEREKREDIFRHGVDVARRLRGDAVRLCFVGDTPSDIQAAVSLGLPVIAVATGTYAADELREYLPSLCVATVSELLQDAGEGC